MTASLDRLFAPHHSADEVASSDYRWEPNGGHSLHGGSADDTLHGGGRNDWADGGAGDDLVHGRAGDDYLVASAGSDTLDGGFGRDWAQLGPSYVVRATMTADLRTGEAQLSTGETVTLRSIENVVSSYQHTDVAGDAGANAVWTGAAADTLIGRGGDDSLLAGWGDDSLNGGGGRDLLMGDYGVDVLTGGAGADTFRFIGSDSSRAKPDLITDLGRGDIIDLSRVDADSRTDGNQDFVRVERFDGHAGEFLLRYDPQADTTVLNADTDGNGRADYRILISGDHEGFNGFVT